MDCNSGILQFTAPFSIYSKCRLLCYLFSTRLLLSVCYSVADLTYSKKKKKKEKGEENILLMSILLVSTLDLRRKQLCCILFVTKSFSALKSLSSIKILHTERKLERNVGRRRRGVSNEWEM